MSSCSFPFQANISSSAHYTVYRYMTWTWRNSMISKMAEVTFMCKRTAISSKPVQPGKFSSLSVLDRVMENNHLRIVFYYQSPKDRKFRELTKILRESLSKVLSAFPIITGRLLKDPEDHWMIKCNDAGVRMVEARVKGCVDKWLRNVDRQKELQLVHWEPMFHKPYYWSTFYVQITEFEEGGFAIGLSCTHLLSDPFCATMFMKAWTDITLGGKMISPPLFHPLPPRRLGNRNINHESYTELINHYITILEKPASAFEAKHTTISLGFTEEMVKSCIAMATAPDSPRQSSPTPFEALAALLWLCIRKIKGKKNGLLNMSLCLDMRKVLALDKFFFGNCMVYNRVTGDHIEVNELSKAAIAIREVVKKMDAEGIIDLIEYLEEHDCQNPPWLNGYDLMCANLELMDSYSCTFEDSFKPIRVSYYIEPTSGDGAILILPSPPSEGLLSRVAVVTLPEEEAVRLLDDKLIKQLSPTILMSPDGKYAKINSNP